MNLPIGLFYILAFPLFFILSQLRAGLYVIYIWQLKEYRIDRLWTYIQTRQGKRWMFGLLSSIKWIQFAACLALPFLGRGLGDQLIISVFLPIAELVAVSILTVFVVESLLFLNALLHKRARLPKWTLKSTVVFALFVVIETILLSLVLQRGNAHILGNIFVAIPFIFFDKLRAGIIAILIVVMNIVSRLWYRIVIARAVTKLRKYPKLITVGVTGSYGKTSTKEFLSMILSRKYKVVKTPDMINTDIGVAQTILKSDMRSTDVFIAEMGAYKRGEIAAIARMVHPTVGVITGINEQHIELFGTIQNTMKAKYELIENLKHGGSVVFNQDNEFVRQMMAWAKKRKDLRIMTFGLKHQPSVWADEIKVHPDTLSFTLHQRSSTMAVKVALLGKQHVPNILAAVAVALQLGLTWEEIKKGVEAIVSPPMTMAKAGYYHGALLVDDTFNANADGVRAAVDYLQSASGRKILVLTPLIELGKEAARIHTTLGLYASDGCDYVLVTNENYKEEFLKDVPGAVQDRIIYGNYSALALKLRQLVQKNDTVVFEGKEAGNVLKLL